MYSLALGKGILRKNQEHIGKRCVILQVALAVGGIETFILNSCGVKAQIKERFESRVRQSILGEEREILLSAIKLHYASDKRREKGLFASCMKNLYKDSISKEDLLKIKQNKVKGPLYQSIEDEFIRKSCSQNILLLSSQIFIYNCNISDARELARKLWNKFLSAKKKSG